MPGPGNSLKTGVSGVVEGISDERSFAERHKAARAEAERTGAKIFMTNGVEFMKNGQGIWRRKEDYEADIRLGEYARQNKERSTGNVYYPDMARKAMSKIKVTKFYDLR